MIKHWLRRQSTPVQITIAIAALPFLLIAWPFAAWRTSLRNLLAVLLLLTSIAIGLVSLWAFAWAVGAYDPPPPPPTVCVAAPHGGTVCGPVQPDLT
jgi:hypothetical protein